jgi:uncharacterized metal-binding protein
MFFRRKRHLQKRLNEELISTARRLKAEYYQKKAIVEKSIEPSYSIVMEYKKVEVKYFYTIKQLKSRKIRTENLI